MPKFVPSLKDLPEPPPNKQGWPWTEESKPLPSQMPDGSPWPRISIVTPSYNQGCFIEETIRSILLQGYPNLQYIIMDGGSTDETVEIIRKYEPWLDHWESKKDQGQADAINKGLAIVDGEIFNWINSDDYLASNALKLIGKSFKEECADVVAGACINFWDGTNPHEEGGLAQVFNLDIRYMIYNWRRKYSKAKFFRYHQPAVWLKTEGVKKCGSIDTNFHYFLDGDLIRRYLCLYNKVIYLNTVFVNFRYQQESKTITNRDNDINLFVEEQYKAIKKLKSLSQFSVAHPYCNLYLREKEWVSKVTYIRESDKIPLFFKKIKIMSLMLQDPQVRLSRFTLGAIIRN